MNIVIFVLESRLSKKIKNDVNLLERVFFSVFSEVFLCCILVRVCLRSWFVIKFATINIVPYK